MSDASLILPVPISTYLLNNGGIETLVIRDKEIRFRVPPGGHAGSRIRLPGVAHLIDPSMKGADLHPFVLEEGERLYSVRQDVEVDLCLPEQKMRRGVVECINLGNRKFEVRIPPGIRPGQLVR